MVLFFSCYLIDCGVDEPAGVTDLGDVGNTEQKSQPCRIIASLEKVLTSWGRTKCSWASASMECPFNSPPEAPCRRRSLINIKQHFSYCWWGAESVRPPSRHSEAHLTATLKSHNTHFLLYWYFSHQRRSWKTAMLDNFSEISTRECRDSWPPGEHFSFSRGPAGETIILKFAGVT